MNVRRVMLVIRRKEGEGLFPTFANCGLYDMDTGEPLPAREIQVTFPFPDGLPLVNATLLLHDVRVETIPRNAKGDTNADS